MIEINGGGHDRAFYHGGPIPTRTDVGPGSGRHFKSNSRIREEPRNDYQTKLGRSPQHFGKSVGRVGPPRRPRVARAVLRARARSHCQRRLLGLGARSLPLRRPSTTPSLRPTATLIWCAAPTTSNPTTVVFPVGRWDDVIYVACVEPPTNCPGVLPGSGRRPRDAADLERHRRRPDPRPRPARIRRNAVWFSRRRDQARSRSISTVWV